MATASIDVFMTSVDYCSPVATYHNRGDGTFENRRQAGLPANSGG